jgi:nitrite reductase/ring-hydroxylating ferredoxin subunit/uncharacterized membrane protein
MLPAVRELGARLEQAAALDRVAKPLAGRVSGTLDRLRLKSVLAGSWLGHPLHPPLTDLPIGSWTSAMVLDLVGGRRAQRSADLFVALGIVTAVPTAASGASDWCDLGPREQRVGVVHAAANVAGLGCYVVSYGLRRRGRRTAGVAAGFVGATVLTIGGYLGGHLAFRRGAGVNRNAFVDAPTDWTDLGDAEAPPAGALAVGRAGEVDVVIARHGAGLCGLADRCSHQGGPLHEGELVGGRVRCPWHGSEFRLADGAVERGPATAPQPAFHVRPSGSGRLQARHVPPTD